MVGNRSQFIVDNCGVVALGIDFREANPRPWNTAPGKRLCVRRRRRSGSSAAYDVVDEAYALWWMSALVKKGSGTKVLRCRGEVFFAVGMKMGSNE